MHCMIAPPPAPATCHLLDNKKKDQMPNCSQAIFSSWSDVIMFLLQCLVQFKQHVYQYSSTWSPPPFLVLQTRQVPLHFFLLEPFIVVLRYTLLSRPQESIPKINAGGGESKGILGSLMLLNETSWPWRKVIKRHIQISNAVHLTLVRHENAGTCSTREVVQLRVL